MIISMARIPKEVNSGITTTTKKEAFLEEINLEAKVEKMILNSKTIRLIRNLWVKDLEKLRESITEIKSFLRKVNKKDCTNKIFE